MVGLMRLGEAAWAVEQTMNAWVQEERAATPALLQLIGLAHGYFFRQRQAPQAGESRAMSARSSRPAERVRRGEATEEASREARGAALAPAPNLPFRHAPCSRPRRQPPPRPRRRNPRKFVQLGEHRVSTTLFAIFSGEARAHVIAIREEHETLRQHGVVSDGLLRAVHTLAGTSGTVKISALSDLGYALEKALQKLATSELSEDEQSLVGEAIDTIEAMVESVVELRVPRAVRRSSRAWSTSESKGASLRNRRRPRKANRLLCLRRPAKRDSAAAEELAETEAGDSSLDDLDLDITLERRQRRLDDDIDPELLQIFIVEGQDWFPAVGAAMRGLARQSRQSSARPSPATRAAHPEGSARMAGAMALAS